MILGCIFKDFLKPIVDIKEAKLNLQINQIFIVNCIVSVDSLLLITAQEDNLPTFYLEYYCFVNSSSYSFSNSNTNGIRNPTISNSLFHFLKKSKMMNIHIQIQLSTIHYKQFLYQIVNLTHHHQMNQSFQKN